MVSRSDFIAHLEKVLGGKDQWSARSLENAATALARADRDTSALAEEVANDATNGSDLRGLAAVVAAISYRRQSMNEASTRAINTLRAVHPDWSFVTGLATHLEALTYLDGSPTRLRRGLQLARQATAAMPDNAGARHSLATFLLDNAIWNCTDPQEEQRLLAEALAECNEALRLQDYPKFHSTRGRILLRVGTTDSINEGLEELEQFVANEQGDSFDYERRLMTYSQERALVELRMATKVAEDRVRNEAIEIAGEVRKDADRKLSEFESKISEETRRSFSQLLSVMAFLTSLLGIVQFSAGVYGIMAKDEFKSQFHVREVLIFTAGFSFILMFVTFVGAWLMSRALRKNR